MPKHPGLFKRLAAMLYDSMLLFGVLFAASLIIVPFVDNPDWGKNPLFGLYLLAVIFLYFGYAWTRSGQTLGMKTWKLRVQQPDGSGITWQQAGVRFIGAIISLLVFGLGYLWILFDKDNKTWHDRISKTEIVKL